MTDRAPSLLSPDEPAAYEVVRADGASEWFLLCDHASNRLPVSLATLGMTDDQLDDHIAWDIGAAELARLLSRELDAPLVLSGYSRLAIDCNRPPGVASSVPAVTCAIPVPGNAGLDELELRAREEQLFWPYHRAIGELLAQREARGLSSRVLSVHSFTPALHGKARPWHVGVMYGKDRRLAGALLEALAHEPDLTVGDNEPYQVSDGTDFGVPVYAERAGRLGVLVEVRQDLIASASGVEQMGAVLLRALARVSEMLARGAPW